MIGKPKILVVDDDLAALELIAGTLQSLAVRPCCVQSSRAAAELISKAKFDGIFLDWLMPEMGEPLDSPVKGNFPPAFEI